MKTSIKKLNSILEKELIQIFIQLVADLKNQKEVEVFLKDFLTESEFSGLVKRLGVAYWLKKGRSYQNIKGNLKVSSATVAELQSMMDSEGLKLALKKIEAEEWASKWSEKIKKFVGK